MESREETQRKFYSLESDTLIAGIIVAILLYIFSLENYLLFHTLAELFSAFVAYIVFLITWKARNSLLNRYLLFIGVSFFFIGTFDLLHALSFNGVGLFPGFDSNLSTQFWIIGRFIESVSFLIASLFIVQARKNYMTDSINDMTNSILIKNYQLTEKIFFIYSIITAYLLISVLCLKNFPNYYFEGSGVTSFNLISEYMITSLFCCSLVLLYKRRDRFEREVFILIAVSIFLAIFGELPFIFYSHMDNFPGYVGHLFKVLSFYFIYKAIVKTGFEVPYSPLSRELKQREEALTKGATFLSKKPLLIYNLLGMNRNSLMRRTATEDLARTNEKCLSIIRDFSRIIFQLDKDLFPVFIEGAIKEITGYSKEDIFSGNLKLERIIEPENLSDVSKEIVHFVSGPVPSVELECRIRRKDGEKRWIKTMIRRIPNSSDKMEKFQGSIYDITERKKIEETVKRREDARMKEIHHRIKNNLQVISSLLDLQAETFSGHEVCKVPEVIEAFKESQNRVISMALIHEELYKSKDIVTLDFASYLRQLTAKLLSLYTIENKNISLKLNLEQTCLGMDIAIPLGIIVNELISNSLKYAFSPGKQGEIRIILYRNENSDRILRDSADSRKERSGSRKDFEYTLVVADNGPGIPEEIDIGTTDSLGLQLINVLVDQVDGYFELNRKDGTEFRISFNSILSPNH